MAYVPEDSGVILFGGLAHNRSLADTWLFRNGHWTNLTAGLSLSPPPRYKAVFVNDPLERGAILFGGNAGLVYRNDTWKWNGTAWSQVLATVAPSPREDAAGAFDVADGYLLLVGGEEISGGFVADTWSYLHGVWTDLTSSVGAAPPAREAGSAVYDAADGYVLLFGGKSNTTQLIRDTWTYHAGVWTNLTPSLAVQPPARESFNLVYDSVDGYVLLYGGFHFPSSLSDEWSYLNGTWSMLNLSSTPPPREDAAMAYDPAPALPFVVLFGGRTNPASTGVLLNDTWSYKRPISLQVAGTTPIDLGESEALHLSAIGGYQPLTLTWQNLPSGCTSANVTLIGCTPNATGTFPVNVTAVDVGGFSATSPDFNLTINPLPSVVASANASAGSAPLVVALTSVVTGGSAPFTYLWQLGDGSSSTLADPVHTYGPGSFEVALTVTDGRGFNATATVGPINVTAPAIPLSVVASADLSSGVAPLTVHFDASATGGAAPYRFNWSFGTGASANGSASAAYTYTSPGVYDAIVAVTDVLDEQVTGSVSVTVSAPQALSASASATPGGGLAPLTVDFSGSASGGVAPYRYAWSFGPAGATSTLQNPTYIYTSGGTFTATLTVTDNASSETTATVAVVVAAALSASFTASAGTPYCVGSTGYALVNVSATASGGTGGYVYLWGFPLVVQWPYGGSASGVATAPAGASYTISLTVNDSGGHAVSSERNVTAGAISCIAQSTGPSANPPWLLYALIGIVAVVIGVEAVLLLRRRRSE